MSEPVIAYLGVGANEGERAEQIRAALERLDRCPGVRVLNVSALRETEPVVDGGPESGPPLSPFLNGVARLQTILSPRALLGVCQALERRAGRRLPAPRNSPRSLDLDLLLYDDRRVDEVGLRIPHPRMFEREFVLEPLAELGVSLDGVPRWDPPQIVREPLAFAALCSSWQAGGCMVGVVPTMGALHAGHRSLVARARQECDRVVVTVFVNPLQFAAGDDFEVYPRDLTADVAVARAEGADAVFAPEGAAMFGAGFCSFVAVGAEAEGMEGAIRPGHFAGVATVVARLLGLSRPHRAYFGAKDAQQLAVVRRMSQDLGFPTEIVECPIVREPDGLAMSSRNVYLSPADRRAAPVLFAALCAARDAHRRGERDAGAILEAARLVLEGEPRAAVEYLELRAENDLPALAAGPAHGGRLLVAARFSGDGGRPVRLIDNLSLTGQRSPAPGEVS